MNTIILNDGTNTYQEKFIELMTYCFKMCTEEEFRRDWEKAAQVDAKQMIMGVEVDEELASSITLTKRVIYLDGKELSMYGLGGVATASTHRSGGICSRLIKEGIRKMYEEGAIFSMLAPFSYEFYEKLGWKWCYTSNTYAFEIERLKSFKGKGKIEKIRESNFELLDCYYHDWIETMNGMTKRDKEDWFKRVDANEDRYTVVYKDDAGEVLGYMIYKIDNTQSAFQVLELSYKKLEAIKGIYQYIYMHRAQVNQVMIMTVGNTKILDILGNPRCETKQISYMMGRIIRVEEALKAYNFQKDGTFYIKVIDDIVEENTGCFKLCIQNHEVIEISRIEGMDEVNLEIDIRELTQLVMGFRTLEELEELERVEIYQEDIKSYFKDRRSEVALYDFF